MTGYAVNGQLGPRRFVRRVGVGDASFDELDKDKTFDQAWQVVQGQMNSEGATGLDVASAKNAFASAYQQLFDQGVQAGDALTASQKYVTGIHTIAGAAESVAGLVNAVSGGAPPLQIAQLFTGTMIGVAVAVGAVSAGVGAAIVGGVAALTSILSGLFGSSPGFQIPGCPGQSSAPPAWSAGCMGYFPPGGRTAEDMRTMPNSNLWRRFPDPANGPDQGWFLVNADSVATADGGSWQAFLAPNSGMRPIDVAFPAYYALECQGAVPMPDPSNTMATRARELDNAFFAAWKLNQEYALNGLTPQPDWRVLAHVLRLWNKTHAPTGSLTISSGGSTANFGDACPGGLSYEETLVDPILRNPVDGDDAFVSGGALFYNTGDIITPPHPLPLKLRGLPPKKTPSPPMSTGKKVAVAGAVAAGGALAGVGLYAFLTHQAYGVAFGKLWGEVKKAAKRL